MKLLARYFWIAAAIATFVNALCLPAQFGLPVDAWTLFVAAIGYACMIWLALRYAFPNSKWLRDLT